MNAEPALTGSNTVTPFPYWLVTVDGTRLRLRRHARGLSQERLSYRSGVSLRTIQRVEKLTAASCHFGTLQQLARALGTDPGALISELAAGDSSSVPVALRPLPQPRPDPWWQRAKPFPSSRTERGRYDAATARELLAMTSEFPDSKAGMLMLLTEYRHALYDIAVKSDGKPN